MSQLQQTHRVELQQKDIQHMRAVHQLEERQQQREEELREELQHKEVLLQQKNSDISRLQSEIERLQVGASPKFANASRHVLYYRLASSPDPLRGKREGPGTHCLRMLRYPKNLRGSYTIVFFLYRYFPFDLNSSSLSDPEITSMDGSSSERYFELAREMLPCRLMKDFK